MKQVTLTRFFKRKEPLNEANTPQKDANAETVAPKTPTAPKTPRATATSQSRATPRSKTPKTPEVPIHQDSDEDEVPVKRIRTDKENVRKIVDSDDEMEQSFSKVMDLNAFRMTPKGTDSPMGTPRNLRTVATPKSTKVFLPQLGREIQGKE
jgi:hypothetical protein